MFSNYVSENLKKRQSDFSLDSAKFKKLCEEDCQRECPFSDDFNGPVFYRLSIAFVRFDSSEICALMPGWVKLTQLARKLDVHKLHSGRDRKVTPYFEFDTTLSAPSSEVKRARLDRENRATFKVSGDLVLETSVLEWLLTNSGAREATFVQEETHLQQNLKSLSGLDMEFVPRLRSVRFSLLASTCERKIVWAKVGEQFKAFFPFANSIEIFANVNSHYFVKYWTDELTLFVHSVSYNLKLCQLFTQVLSVRVIVLRSSFLTSSTVPELLKLCDYLENRRSQTVIVFLAPDPIQCLANLVKLLGTLKLSKLEFVKFGIKQTCVLASPVYIDVDAEHILSDKTTVLLFYSGAPLASSVNSVQFQRFKLVMYRNELTTSNLKTCFSESFARNVTFEFHVLNNKHLPISNDISRIIERKFFASDVCNPNLTLDFGINVEPVQQLVPSERKYRIAHLDSHPNLETQAIHEFDFEILDYL